MAARPPAQRTPTSSTASNPPTRPEAAHNPRQHHRGHNATRPPPSSSSDEDMDEPLDLPTPQTMERPELGPEWSDDDDTPPRRRMHDIPIDPTLLNDEDEPYEPPDEQRRTARFDPVDDALRSQGHAGRSHSVARLPRPELAPDSPPPRATHSRHPQQSQAHTGAGNPGKSKGKGKERETGGKEDGSGSGSENGSSGGGSNGSAMTVDPEPHHPPPPPPPAWNFNPHLYPAYDRNGGRIGLEHTRHASRPAQGGGSYYLPRTRNYPTAGEDLPHVMELDFRVDPASIAPVSASNPPAPRGRPRGTSTGASRGQAAGSSRTQHRAPAPRETSPSSEEDAASPHPPPPPIGPEDLNPDIPDPEPALRELLGFTPEEEVSLRSLVDPPNGEKPGYPYPTLIKLAIYGSPNKRLTLQEIYQALIDRFQWFKDNADDKAWQGSIRHNLSLNKCFRKVPRPISEPGKGSFWVVDYSQGEGNKRQRKRNKKKTKAQREAEAAAAAAAAAAAKDTPQVERERLEELAQRESDRQRGYISDDSPPGGPSPLPVPAPAPMRAPASAAGSSRAHARHLPHGAPQGGLPPTMWAEKQNKGRLMHVLNTPDHMTIPVPPSARATPEPYRPASRASTIAAQLDEAHIDPPELGHVVGEGRARQSARSSRASASPYQPSMDIRRRARSRHRDSCEPSVPPAIQATPQVRPQINPMWGVPAFGQPSLRAAPPNWTPYGSPGSSQIHRPAPGIPTFPSSNTLGLSAASPGPSPSAAGSSEPSSSRRSAEAGRRRHPVSNVRESRQSTSSRAQPAPPREGQRRSTRLSNKHDDDYVDSRGTVYPSRGREPESESDDDFQGR